MAEEQKEAHKPDPSAPENPAPPRQRRRWPRRLLAILGILLILLVALYLYVTSASFFRTWVQPRVAQALGRPFEVGAYKFSPSGWLSLGKVTVGAKPGEDGPALTLDNFECHFSPTALRRNVVRIKSLHLTGLNVTVRQNESGALSGPFPAGSTAAAPKTRPAAPAKPAGVPSLQLPVQLDLHDIQVDQVAVRMEKAVRGKVHPAVMALTGFSMKCPTLTLDGKSTVTVAANVESRPASNDQDAEAQGFAARLAMTINTEVTAGALRDVAVKTNLTDFTGTVQGEDLAAYAAGMNMELKIAEDGRSGQLLPTAFYVQQKDKDLARVSLEGVVDLAKQSGEVSLNVQPIDRRVLNLAGASQGIDFRDTKVSGNFKMVIGEQGALRSLEAEFGVQDLNPAGGPLLEGGFPRTNIDAVVNASTPKDSKSLSLDVLRARVTQGTAEPVVAVDMAKPIALDPKTMQPASGAFGADALKLTVKNLNLSEWVALLARNAGVKLDRGTLAADLKIGSGDGAPGDSVVLAGTVTVADLHGTQGEAAVGPLNASTRLNAVLGLAAKHLALAECATTLTSGDKALGALGLTAALDLAPLQGDATVDLKDFDFSRLPLPVLAQAAQTVRSGKLGGSIAIHAEGDRVTADGKIGIPALVMTNPTDAKAEPLSLPVSIAVKKVVDLKAHVARLEQLEVTGAEGGGALRATGEVTYVPALSGKMDLEAQDFKLTPLMPLLAAASGKADLSQAALSCKQALTFALADAGVTAGATGSVRLTGLSPAAAPAGGKRARTDVAVDNDVALAGAVADVRKCSVQISHDGGKADVVTVTGKMDPAKPEASSLAVASASLDLQPLLPFGGVQPAEDAPALTVQNLKVTLAMLAGGGVAAKDLALEIAKGKVACPSFTMEKQAGAADPVLKWQNCAGSGLDVDTLLANLAPANRGKLTGTAEFATTGQAQGFGQEAMAQALRVKLDSKIENGELTNIPLTNEIAAVTHLNELKDMKFTRLDGDVTTDEKGIQLTEVDLVGPEEKIVVKGTVGYDMKLDLPLALAVGGNLKSRVAGQSYAAVLKQDEEGYLNFPAPLAVGGTAAKPSVKINLEALSTKEVLDMGLGLLNQKMKNKGSGSGSKASLGGLLQGLGGGKSDTAAPAASGTAPKSAKTDAATPKAAKAGAATPAAKNAPPAPQTETPTPKKAAKSPTATPTPKPEAAAAKADAPPPTVASPAPKKTEAAATPAAQPAAAPRKASPSAAPAVTAKASPAPTAKPAPSAKPTASTAGAAKASPTAAATARSNAGTTTGTLKTAPKPAPAKAAGQANRK